MKSKDIYLGLMNRGSEAPTALSVSTSVDASVACGYGAKPVVMSVPAASTSRHLCDLTILAQVKTIYYYEAFANYSLEPLYSSVLPFLSNRGMPVLAFVPSITTRSPFSKVGMYAGK